MKTLNRRELIEICFSLLNDKVPRNKTDKKNFVSGRRKLISELRKLSK